MSDECRCRIRYSTASAGVTWSSPGVRKAVVRADTSVDSEAMPGVSISVIWRSDDDGHSITSRSTSSGSTPPRSTAMAPPSRVNGHLAGLAVRGLQRGPVGDAVAVPGDDAGALARVGGAPAPRPPGR